jgi:hypothetical protein
MITSFAMRDRDPLRPETRDDHAAYIASRL